MTTRAPRFCESIISGGQTGVDRAALDFAIRHGYPYGGWIPKGRMAEDGPLAAQYVLQEIEGGYRLRTRRNVEDSEGTLILNRGELDGGTLQTARFAERLRKPYFVVDLDQPPPVAAAEIVNWLATQPRGRLNVAGPREGKRPGIYAATLTLLEAIQQAVTLPPSPTSIWRS